MTTARSIARSPSSSLTSTVIAALRTHVRQADRALGPGVDDAGQGRVDLDQAVDLGDQLLRLGPRAGDRGEDPCAVTGLDGSEKRNVAARTSA